MAYGDVIEQAAATATHEHGFGDAEGKTPAERFARATSWEPLAFDVEFLTVREAAAEDLMLGTRMSAGASAAVVARAREAIGAAAVDAAVGRVVAGGLAELTATGALAPTERGWLLGNVLYGELWDLASGA